MICDISYVTYGFLIEISGGPRFTNIVLDNRSSGIYEHYEYGAAMFDLSVRSDTGAVNQTPVATLPGEFLMQANCKNSYKVQMSDPDGDKVKCRWAVRGESNDNAVRGSNLSSLTLDTETCTVTYDGSLDNICTGSNSQVRDLFMLKAELVHS